MKINKARPPALCADSSRLLLLYLSAFAVSVGFMTVVERFAVPATTASHKDAPPLEIQWRAEQITHALFPDAAPAALVWNRLNAQRLHGGIIWAADFQIGADQNGRLQFDPTGRLSHCSRQITGMESPLRNREDALRIAHAKIRALQKKDWYDCHLCEEKPFHPPGQTQGSWFIRGQKTGKRILLTLDARTGALLSFSETISGSIEGSSVKR